MTTNAVELRRLLRDAQTDFRKLNRTTGLTRSDKTRLKTFYLNRVLGPEAQKLLHGLYPASVSANGTARDGQRLLTAPDLETRLNISRKTIYAYAKRDLIPHVRIGGNVRFREPEIRRWIKRHRRASVSSPSNTPIRQK